MGRDSIETEEIMHIRVKEKKEVLNIVNVYITEGKKDIEDVIPKKIAVYENEDIIMGGDFNIRIGELGGVNEEWNIGEKRIER